MLDTLHVVSSHDTFDVKLFSILVCIYPNDFTPDNIKLVYHFQSAVLDITKMMESVISVWETQ